MTELRYIGKPAQSFSESFFAFLASLGDIFDFLSTLCKGGELA
jgi:hypothetical protein